MLTIYQGTAMSVSSFASCICSPKGWRFISGQLIFELVHRTQSIACKASSIILGLWLSRFGTWVSSWENDTSSLCYLNRRVPTGDKVEFQAGKER